MQKVAFFDIDGTVFRSSLLIELVERLVDAHIFPISARSQYITQYTAWRNREGTYDAYIKALVKVYVKHIAGVDQLSVVELGHEVVAEHSKQVYRYTRDLIPTLKKRGYFVVAISQSPKEILDDFCASYGFDKVYGRQYEVDEDTKTYTGTVLDEHLIQDKSNIFKRVFDRGDFDTTATVAVGDTEDDISMLALAQQPICFNPNNTLYQYAMRMGWKVVVERKDVIYEL
jgi:HAD superfamily hydrolase (TIGR01490 family)